MPSPNETEKLAKYEEWNAKFAAAAGKAEVIVAKQRHGSTGIVRVRFDGRTTSSATPSTRDICRRCAASSATGPGRG